MEFSPFEDEVDLYVDGFSDDAYGRREFGVRISNIFENIEDPLVVALDGRWGTGKTYFLKRWVGAHKSENSGRANTLYFDAFAHDYHSDPLVGLVASLADKFPKETGSHLNRVKKGGIRLGQAYRSCRAGLGIFRCNERFV